AVTRRRLCAGPESTSASGMSRRAAGQPWRCSATRNYPGWPPSAGTSRRRHSSVACADLAQSLVLAPQRDRRAVVVARSYVAEEATAVGGVERSRVVAVDRWRVRDAVGVRVRRVRRAVGAAPKEERDDAGVHVGLEVRAA